jgi:hypothetical protein
MAMWGKVFSTMFEGSLRGKGAVVFSVMTYIITKTQNSVVTLNPEVVAFLIGCKTCEVKDAIDLLCAPDPDSNLKEHEGRRLIREAQFQYRVVNWAYYNSIRNEEERKESNRVAAARYREKKQMEDSAKALRKAAKHKSLTNEDAAVRAEKDGNQALADKLAEPVVKVAPVEQIEHLPGSVPVEDCPPGLT